MKYETEKLKNEVVTLITIIGEVIGRLTSFKDGVAVLSSPRILVTSQDGSGNFGFAPSIGVTAEQNLGEAEFLPGSYITIVRTDKNISEAWSRYTSSFILAK